MSRLAAFAFILVLTTSVCRADEDDDTLSFYLSKSDVAVVGMIVSKPQVTIDERGVANFYCDFHVADVCHGNTKYRGKTIHVNIHRFYAPGEKRHPLITQDAECLLYLKLESDDAIPEFVTANFWFGLQHPSESMARSLMRIVKEQAAKQN
jgi:hypothetical protein